jgi:hypothetical protein
MVRMNPRGIGLRPIFFLAVLVCFLGCATVPSFVPSKPLSALTSFQEGLFICSEYRAPLEAKRVSSLLPYLRCLDQLSENFIGFDTQPTLQVFHTELKSRYDILNEVYWSPALAKEYEIAIHAVLRGIWREGSLPANYTWREKTTILELFPKTAWYLDVSNMRTAKHSDRDREFEALLIQFLTLKNVLSEATHLAHHANCSDPTLLSLQILRLNELRKDLELARELAVNSPEETRIQNRYAQELRQAWQLLASVQKRKSELSRCNLTLNLPK